MSLFYLCTENNCHRKYKTRNKLVQHLLKDHQVVDADIGEPIEITKENKNSIDKISDRKKKSDAQEKILRELEAKKKIEMDAKKIAEEEYKKKKLDEYKMIEEQQLLKIQLERELEEKHLSILESIAKNIGDSITQCSICIQNPCDTAVVPCGHKFFCYECINSYLKTYAHRGCPICRGEMMFVTKIFG